MLKSPPQLEIQIWPIERLIFYVRNPRKNEAVVDRMCSSIREFGFKVPVLARSDGEVVDGHLRLKAARKLGSWPGGDTTGIPVILCDEWTEAQVKAFRLLVNRSVTWAAWDAEFLSLELLDLKKVGLRPFAYRLRHERVEHLSCRRGRGRRHYRRGCRSRTSREAS
jgi:hypothetical protein